MPPMLISCHDSIRCFHFLHYHHFSFADWLSPSPSPFFAVAVSRCRLTPPFTSWFHGYADKASAIAADLPPAPAPPPLPLSQCADAIAAAAVNYI